MVAEAVPAAGPAPIANTGQRDYYWIRSFLAGGKVVIMPKVLTNNVAESNNNNYRVI